MSAPAPLRLMRDAARLADGLHALRLELLRRGWVGEQEIQALIHDADDLANFAAEAAADLVAEEVDDGR
jgi:hypothetical protein